jgi:uncharacterized membrane protein
MTYKGKRILAMTLLVVLLVTSGGYYFGSGLLSRVSGAISMACVLLGLVYMMRFAPTQDEIDEHKSKKGPGE